MPFRAVFFDLDDTLLDTTGTQRDRAERVALRLARELPGLDCGYFVDRALAKDPRTGWSVGVATLIEELGFAGTNAGREALDLWFFQGCPDLAHCFEGAKEVLTELASVYTLGVITNGRESRQRYKFESLGLHSFQVFLTSERAGYEKPAPEIFRLALAEAEVAPAEAVFVGDRLDVDVLGAKDAGMLSVWLDHDGRIPAGVGPKPHAVIRHFGELPSILRHLGPL